MLFLIPIWFFHGRKYFKGPQITFHLGDGQTVTTGPEDMTDSGVIGGAGMLEGKKLENSPESNGVTESSEEKKVAEEKGALSSEVRPVPSGEVDGQ